MRPSFEEQLERYRSDSEFNTEVLLLDINEQLVSWMQQQGIRRSELAQRLGVSRAFVTKLLEGNPNITIRTLCKVATALGLTVNMQLALPLPDMAEHRVVPFSQVLAPPLEALIADESAVAA